MIVGVAFSALGSPCLAVAQTARPSDRAAAGQASRLGPQPVVLLTGSAGVSRDWFGSKGSGLSPGGDFVTGDVALSVNPVTSPTSRVSAAGDANASVWYDPRRDVALSHYNASVAAGWNLTRRVLLSATAGLTIEPLVLSTLFPGLSTPALSTLAGQLGVSQHYSTYRGGLSAAYLLSRRSRLTAAFDRESSSGAAAYRRRTTHAAVSFDHAVTRGLGVRLGYGEYASQYADATTQTAPFRQRALDVGINYGATLSFARRTSLAFSTGTIAVVEAGMTRYDIVGSGRLQHRWGRTGEVSAEVSRQVQFVNALLQPTFSNTAQLALFGGLRGALGFNASAGVSDGSVGFSSRASRFRAITGGAGLSMALGQTWSLQAGYSYGAYTFDQTVVVPGLVTGEFRRHGVQFGVAAALPLITTVRRGTNAAR